MGDESSRYFLKLAATADMSSHGGSTLDIKNEMKKYARFIFANKVNATDSRLAKSAAKVAREQTKMLKDEE